MRRANLPRPQRPARPIEKWGCSFWSSREARNFNQYPHTFVIILFDVWKTRTLCLHWALFRLSLFQEVRNGRSVGRCLMISITLRCMCNLAIDERLNHHHQSDWSMQYHAIAFVVATTLVHQQCLLFPSLWTISAVVAQTRTKELVISLSWNTSWIFLWLR